MQKTGLKDHAVVEILIHLLNSFPWKRAMIIVRAPVLRAATPILCVGRRNRKNELFANGRGECKERKDTSL